MAWEGEWVDDEEFLAPPGMNRTDESVDEDDGLEPDDVGWEPSQGFPDGRRAVRVWADDDGVMTRVRVSLNWREKLKGSSLETAFWTAFTAMNAIFHTTRHVLPLPEPLPVTPYPTSAGWDALRMARLERAEVDAKMAKLADAPPTRWVGQSVQGSDFEDGVVVTLGLFGQPVSAKFDPKWLKTSVRSSELSRGVLGAYRRARAKYQPPQIEFGERELLAREYTRINASLLETLGNGFSF
ncbi:hypothetical protein HMPREF1531_01153 [Propionibacterium sp. oral taxon 192 str. F0372]|uniref:hypothetical protein n=1 Tax=Propionibacterium sp. oral taxon 192 TaxID=671222 RepID=UPI0003539EDA|nr:hypothetical protein [Propionibacterium sp. oral taxon 192]EPH04092.1 hypothetical protein HMPREF1531_01153 [Propionibacterium sp. oral taxon 192 str. F0372]